MRSYIYIRRDYSDFTALLKTGMCSSYILNSFIGNYPTERLSVLLLFVLFMIIGLNGRFIKRAFCALRIVA